jgi:hypothetical protein
MEAVIVPLLYLVLILYFGYIALNSDSGDE